MRIYNKWIDNHFYIKINNTLKNIYIFEEELDSNELVDRVDFKNNTLNQYGLFISGKPYLLDKERLIDEVFIKQKYDYLSTIKGDFLIIMFDKEKIIVFNSLESQNELFWLYENGWLKISPYHYKIDESIDENNLGLLCYGEGINIFKNIKVLKRGQLLTLKKNSSVCISSVETQPINSSVLCNMGLFELSEITYELIKNSIKRKICNRKNIGVMLSGGIDSSVIARVLYDLNVNATFITWASTNSLPDESKYADELCKKLGYKTNKIFVDSDIDLLPKMKAKYFPYTHSVSSWWESACLFAKSQNIDILLSGQFAGFFDDSFSLKKCTTRKEMLTNMIHAYSNPWFNENIFKKDKKNNIYDASNVFRKMDVFTEKSQETIIHYINRSDFDEFKMRTQEYSYKLNLFEPNEIYHDTPYLDIDIISFTKALPQEAKNCYCDGQNINKILLRYAMIGKIPHDIISRNYSANLSYMTQKNLLDFLKSNNNYFDSNSILVRKGILNVDNINDIISSKNKIQSNSMLSIAILIEDWLRRM